MKLIITGGHSGIGLELSNMLVHAGHELALVVRNQQRAEAVKKDLAKPENVRFFYADLSLQSDVQRLASEITTHWPVIDGLFNNAGVLLDKNYYSRQGNEMHLEVNVLAPVLLVRLLAESLQKAEAPFVINTATGGLHKQKALDLTHLIKPTKYVKLMGAYYQSKLALVLMMKRLAAQYPDIKILNVDPGALKTKMTADADAMPGFMKIIRALFFQPPQKGAQKLYQAAFSDHFIRETGVYITGNKVKPVPLAIQDKDYAAILAGLKE